jgi:hypothetical protein
VTLDNALWLGGAGLEMILLVLLVRRRVNRTLPVFFFFLVWCLGGDAVEMTLTRYFPATDMPVFLVDSTVNTIFQLAVLAELGASASRHSNRSARPSRPLAVLLLAVACALVCSLAKWAVPAYPGFLDRLCLILLQAFAILRVGAMLALVWWSSLRDLHWPEPELRIATGIGLYSLVSWASISSKLTISPAWSTTRFTRSRCLVTLVC